MGREVVEWRCDEVALQWSDGVAECWGGGAV